MEFWSAAVIGGMPDDVSKKVLVKTLERRYYGLLNAKLTEQFKRVHKLTYSRASREIELLIISLVFQHSFQAFQIDLIGRIYHPVHLQLIHD